MSYNALHTSPLGMAFFPDLHSGTIADRNVSPSQKIIGQNSQFSTVGHHQDIKKYFKAKVPTVVRAPLPPTNKIDPVDMQMIY
jgi:hypothetical protein